MHRIACHPSYTDAKPHISPAFEPYEGLRMGAGLPTPCTRAAVRATPGTPVPRRPWAAGHRVVRATRRERYFFGLSEADSVDSAATKASCGTSTRPMVFMRFLPSFCFSSSLRFREMSPP